mgnify:CR=1 FL=1
MHRAGATSLLSSPSFPGKASDEHSTTDLVVEGAIPQPKPLLLRAAGDRATPGGGKLCRLLGVHRSTQRNSGDASHGWIGTELVTGSYARHSAISSFFESIPVIGFFPSLAPRSLKRAQQAPKRIIIAARACQVAGRPASELWCFDGDITSMDPMVANAFMDTALHKQGTLLGTPKRFFGGDLPKDHLFYFQNIATMRSNAKMNRQY